MPASPEISNTRDRPVADVSRGASQSLDLTCARDEQLLRRGAARWRGADRRQIGVYEREHVFGASESLERVFTVADEGCAFGQIVGHEVVGRP